jgi:RNA polymerase sigma-70 factor, ECF subfamily
VLGLMAKYDVTDVAGEPVMVNGDLGLLLPFVPGDAEHLEIARRVSAFAIRDGKIAGFYDMANPEKLTRVRT